MAKYQIRDATGGIALYDGGDAKEALLDFVGNRARAAVAVDVTVDGDAAAVTFEGVVYEAVRFEPAIE